MSVSSVATTGYSTTANATDTASRVPQKALGQADFLKLMTTQLAQQDPEKPMDDTAFISQMAQFSSLQATSQLSTDFSAFRANQDLSSATSLLGRQVTVATKSGSVAGMVTAVDASSGTPQVEINGTMYPYSTVTRVTPTTTTSS